MSNLLHQTPRSSGRMSMFHQDMMSPASVSKGKIFSSGKAAAAAASAPWRDNFGSSDLPPPPVFTLEDRSDFSPEAGISDYSPSPEVKSDMRTPARHSGKGIMNVAKDKLETGDLTSSQKSHPDSAGSSWWSPARAFNNELEEKGKSLPVQGVLLQPGPLMLLPPPREVARPEIQQNCLLLGNLDDEKWVTVYGFPLGDTNFVLREFEKCGVILKHVPGPRDANWMHILYQNGADAKKALSKNGMQINGVMIIGVKPVDPTQHHALNERLHAQGFMPSLPVPPSSSTRAPDLDRSRPSPRLSFLQNGSHKSPTSVASPAKSVMSKVFDVIFGV